MPYFFLLPSLLGILLFRMIPFLDVVRRSFLNALGDKPTGWSNYIMLFQNRSFQKAVSNTGRFLVVCIPLLLFLSLLFALLIQGLPDSRDNWKAIFLLPKAIPVASVVLIWRLVFDRLGYLNMFLTLFQRESIDWMHEESSFYVLIFTYIWKNLGYHIILWIAGLNTISQTLYEAAKADGAKSRQCFFYITLPLLKNTFYFVCVLSFVNSFQVFREVYLVAGEYPQESIYMLQHLFNHWFIQMDFDKMSAAAVMMALFYLFLLAILKKGMGGFHE